MDNETVTTGNLQEYRDELKQRLEQQRAALETTTKNLQHPEDLGQKPSSQPEQQVADTAEESEITIADPITEGFADVSREREGILSIVSGLEGQVNTSNKLKEVLETDLDETQKKLSEELSARAEFEERIKSLEIEVTLVDQLRKDISVATKEWSTLAKLLVQVQPQIEAMTTEHNSLAKEIVSAVANAKELEGDKKVLEVQFTNLREKVAEMDQLQQKLAEVTQSRRDLNEQIRDMTSRLESSERSRETLEEDMEQAQDTVHNLREEVDKMKEKLTGAGSQESDLRQQLVKQTAELVAVNERLQTKINDHRQSEEMISEIKLRLLSLTQKQSIMPAALLRSQSNTTD